MKKIHSFLNEHGRRATVAYRKYERRLAGIKKHTSRKNKYLRGVSHDSLSIKIKNRSEFVKKYYAKIRFKIGKSKIVVKGEFGVEEQVSVSRFFDIAMQMLSTDKMNIIIDLTECTRIWPSAITLLCAFKQWIDLVSTKGMRPTIEQYSSKTPTVNSYLDHCGFYNYVNISGRDRTVVYSESEVVKIRREEKGSDTESREKEIKQLLSKYTDLTSDEIEIFDDRIATEIFNNVTEHGISRKDAGWWILGQHHRKHGIISLCIADNGIGIRNSLMTGPQRDVLKNELSNTPQHEGAFIKKAIEKNISGAYTASIKEPLVFGLYERYPRGERRGKGLERIKQNCIRLGIRLAILSCHGYYILDENGHEVLCGGQESRIFAGTMYHLTIRTERNLSENN